MLTLDLKSDGAIADVSLAKSLEFNLGVRVTLNGQPLPAEFVSAVVADELHPVLEKGVVQEPATPIPSFQDLLNQQVPPTEVVESSP